MSAARHLPTPTLAEAEATVRSWQLGGGSRMAVILAEYDRRGREIEQLRAELTELRAQPTALVELDPSLTAEQSERLVREFSEAARTRPAMPRWLPLGPGEDDAEVWIPPRNDAMYYRHCNPCPHCQSSAWHARTGRCGDCGRRP